MSASYLKAQGGFSLLELMVVLAITAMVSAVVFPGLAQLFTAINNNVEYEQIVIDINTLGRKAYESRQGYVLTSAPIQLPSGWQLETPVPIFYSNKGACSGGKLRLLKDQLLYDEVELAAPFCQVRFEDG